MPDKGNIRLTNQGIWAAFDGENWVPLNHYYVSDPGDLRGMDQQRVYENLIGALHGLKPVQVTGTSPSTYVFQIGTDVVTEGRLADGPFRPAQDVTNYNLTGFMDRYRQHLTRGTPAQFEFTGEIEPFFDILGWPKLEAGQEGAANPRKFEKPGPMEGIYEPCNMGFMEKVGDKPGAPVFDPQSYNTFINGVKTYLGLSPDMIVNHTLDDGRKITSFEGEHYVQEPKPTGNWDLDTISDENRIPRFMGVTDPSGKFSVHEIGSQAASEYRMLTEQAGGQVSASAQRAQPLTEGAVIPDVVPGYDAVQTSAGKYELVEQAFLGDAAIGKAVSLGDGRFAVKLGPDDYEIVTPTPFGEGDTYTDGWGQSYMRQPDGSVSQITPPTIDEQINQSLVSGDPDRALALSDFRDRPDAQERFQAAMDYARQPGDLMAISAIVRGLVIPTDIPDERTGEIRRIILSLLRSSCSW